ncbi:MAG: hypothetical protein HRU70_05110 [Phycisphaeraceae bacterium]|nr:MAG: hypothetical protein HRU70_05110 [Phycisphaeraceae bacterium]
MTAWKTAGVAAMAAWCGLASAQHGGDIVLTIEGGRVVTNRQGGGGTPVPERVFGAEFGGTFPNFTDDPGFDSSPGVFPRPAQVGFRLMAALRVWDGAGFAAIPDERMAVSFGGGALGPVQTPTHDEPVMGFGITGGANGQWHRHYEYMLMPPARAGVYAMAVEMWTTLAGVSPSETFWIVFNQGEDEATHHAAIVWLRGSLAGCAADFNGDGFVDFFDADAFVACFEGVECPADRTGDFNGDGFVDFFDLDAFVSAFEAGC